MIGINTDIIDTVKLGGMDSFFYLRRTSCQMWLKVFVWQQPQRREQCDREIRGVEIFKDECWKLGCEKQRQLWKSQNTS